MLLVLLFFIIPFHLEFFLASLTLQLIKKRLCKRPQHIYGSQDLFFHLRIQIFPQGTTNFHNLKWEKKGYISFDIYVPSA